MHHKFFLVVLFAALAALPLLLVHGSNGTHRILAPVQMPAPPHNTQQF